MPGKYLEYIRAGRYVVPVELTFLPTTFFDATTGNQVTSSKWVERRHWKEIKAMLKPAVDSVTKYNESVTDKISKSHHIQTGQDICFGYIVHLNKEKSPFLAVLDSKKNCWTDDEDDLEVDENIDIADQGGRHKNYTPTKYYIKACISKKPLPASEDVIKSKVRKELGVKSDDVRNYFQSSSSTNSDQHYPGSSSTMTHEKGRTKSPNKKKEKSRKERPDGYHNRPKSCDELSSSESLMDLPPPISHVWGANEGRQLRNPAHIASENSTNHSPEKRGGDLSPEMGRASFIFGEPHHNSENYFRSYLDVDSNEDDENMEDIEELPDIDEDDSVAPPKGRRGRRCGPRKKPMSDRSPSKHNHLNSGLPDIDEGTKGGRAKAKKKRTVAIVEPMKPIRSSNVQISFEEAIGALNLPALAERKRKGRNTSSPTIERLISGSRFKSTNSAIEILGEDSELLPIDIRRSQTAADKRKRKEASERSPRKRRTKKQVEASRYERLTPSPFPESPDENEQNEANQNETSSESEPEMPVLIKMVYTSDEEDQRVEEIVRTATDNPSSPVNVPPLEREVVIDASGQEQENDSVQRDLPENTNEELQTNAASGNNVESVSLENKSDSPSKIKKKKFRKQSPIKSQTTSTPSSNLENSETVSSGTFPKRTRPAASDSDDITSESAYRKKPIRRKRRRKIISIPEPANEVTISTTIIDREDQGEEEEAGNNSERNYSSPRKNTGDAQTQTVFSETLRVAENVLETESEIPEPKKTITKTEMLDENAYDSDYANGVFSDGDDDDVLFEGHFQANLHMPALGSPEDGSEEMELFSFDRPVSVDCETPSINSVASGPSVPMTMTHVPETCPLTVNIGDDDYSFDLVTATINRGEGPQLDARVMRALQNDNHLHHSDDHSNHSDDHEDDYEHDSVENLSTFQLMNYPGTLQAGCGLLSQVISNSLDAEVVYERLGRKNTKEKKKDEDLMPPPPVQRALSPDICSLNPEEQLKKSKPKKVLRKVTGHPTTFSQRSGSPQPGPSSGVRYTQSQLHNIRDTEDPGDEVLHSATGEPFLRELMSRTREPEKRQYEPYGDEFDLSQRSHCMLDVITDYAEKSRLYKKHVKKIKHLPIQELKAHFERIKPEIQGIFEGRIESRRNKLYCSKYQQDRQALRNMNWLKPFKHEHGNVLSACLYDFLLPQPGSRLKYTDYINFVMLPEALIRIFSIVNNVSYETAAKEMRAGPCYEGPFMDS